MIDKSFFERNTIEVAKDLIGKIMTFNGSATVITETEAYHGFDDKACHGYKGKTKRNSVIFDTVGHTYIYLIYGMYNLLNITTMEEGFPGAVLIRGGYDLKDRKVLKGPGILTNHLGIDRSINNVPVFDGKILRLDDKGYRFNIKEGKRIGIDYAQESKDWLWRFYIDPNELNMIH